MGQLVSREPKRSEASLGNCKSSKNVAYVTITPKSAKLLASHRYKVAFGSNKVAFGSRIPVIPNP